MEVRVVGGSHRDTEIVVAAHQPNMSVACGRMGWLMEVRVVGGATEIQK